MPEWLWIIIVGVVVMGLIGFIATDNLRRIGKIFSWKSKMDERGGALTKNEHRVVCEGVVRMVSNDLGTQVQIFKEDVLKQFGEFRNWMQMYVENTVMKEIRSINNGNGRIPISIKKKRVKK